MTILYIIVSDNNDTRANTASSITFPFIGKTYHVQIVCLCLVLFVECLWLLFENLMNEVYIRVLEIGAFSAQKKRKSL